MKLLEAIWNLNIAIPILLAIPLLAAMLCVGWGRGAVLQHTCCRILLMPRLAPLLPLKPQEAQNFFFHAVTAKATCSLVTKIPFYIRQLFR